MADAINIQIPAKVCSVFSGTADYRGLYGGRGSGKTFNVCKISLYIAARRKVRFLCAREIQLTIADSVFYELRSAIESCPYLSSQYEIGRSYIRSKVGSEFIFKGLRHNVSEIKGLGQLDYVWIDEAEGVSEESWRELIPTIRKDGSEIWATWNPKSPESYVHRLFAGTSNDEDGADEDGDHNDIIIKSAKMNWPENPWFTKKLDRERRRHLRNDPATYAHVWEGEFLTLSDAQILNGKWEVKGFEPAASWGHPFFGADFGFSQDPSTLIKCWIYDDCLWIEHEAYGKGIELNDMPRFYDKIPQSRTSVIYADNSRPETISHIKRLGFNIKPCTKWAGSVEDGIAHLRSYRRIYIHPRCKETIREASLYCYKIERKTGRITDDPEDANNHCIDALRYALDKKITRKGGYLY